MKVIFESEEERRAFAILTRALYEIDRNSSHTPLDQVQWEKKIMGADKLEDQMFELEDEIDGIYDQMVALPEGEGDEPTPEYLALQAKHKQLEERKELLEKELRVWEMAEEWALYPERWLEWWTQGQEQEDTLPGPGGEME